jgi:multisubunit Na+/H+ antiporter MnhE subunit
MRAGLEIAGWWAVLVLVWLATLNAYSVEELSVAGVLAVPCAIVARTARRAGAGHWTVRAGWVRWLWWLPWSVVRDTVAVLALATRPDGDDFRTVALAGATTTAELDSHEALATAVLSASPGSVVVDADEDHLLVHALPIRPTRLETVVRR